MEDVAKPIRIPLICDYTIRRFTTTTVNDFYGMSNFVVEKDTAGPQERLVAVTRPTFTNQMTNSTGKTKGRGIFFWESTGNLYIVNDDTVYATPGTDTALTGAEAIGTITSGTAKVYFTQVGTRLVLLDPQNNQGWTITTGGTVARITSPNFPTTLAHGGVTLNGRCYVMDRTGVIYNSSLDDATAWASVDFTEAEREPDGGILLAKHHDNIVAIGKTTVEFFFDNSESQPTGSTLRRRDDIFHTVGGIEGISTCVAGDMIFFIGSGPKGSIGIYKIQGYQVTKISNYSIDGWYTDIIYRQGRKVWLTGFGARGNFYLLTTQYDGTTVNNGGITIVYDNNSGFWQTFSTSLAGYFTTGGAGLSLADWTGNNGVTASVDGSGFGISAQGRIASINNQRDGGGGTQETSIVHSIRTRHTDGESFKWKYCRSAMLVGDVPVQSSDGTAAEATCNLSWSDSIFGSYTTSRSMSIAGDSNNSGVNFVRLTRMGRFKRRSFNLSITESEMLRIEALELEVALGSI